MNSETQLVIRSKLVPAKGSCFRERRDEAASPTFSLLSALVNLILVGLLEFGQNQWKVELNEVVIHSFMP